MALANRVKKQPTSQRGLPCSVATLIEQLEGAELEAFLEMLGTPERRGWSAAAIYAACVAEGYTIGLQTINRHRARPQTCRCGKVGQ